MFNNAQLAHRQFINLQRAETCLLDHEATDQTRITNDDPEIPWLTLSAAVALLDELILAADPEELAFLEEHRAHLAERSQRAALTLSASPNA
jgi:hypothetical protein